LMKIALVARQGRRYESPFGPRDEVIE